jgi:uncharacterized membrane protein YccC
MEPGHFRKDADLGFRFLVLSHTLLSYLSALGAHRGEQLPQTAQAQLLEQAEVLAGSLDEIASGLRDEQPLAIHSDEEQALARSLEQMADDADERQRLVQTQLALICRQLAPLRTLAVHLQRDRH